MNVLILASKGRMLLDGYLNQEIAITTAGLRAVSFVRELQSSSVVDPSRNRYIFGHIFSLEATSFATGTELFDDCACSIASIARHSNHEASLPVVHTAPTLASIALLRRGAWFGLRTVTR